MRALVVSKALTSPHGTVASGANRYDADTIAKYDVLRRRGLRVAYDTSGIDPSADLTLTGHYQFGPAAGASYSSPAAARRRRPSSASSKLNTLIQATGEFSIEAWVAPAVVATDLSDIVSYSGGDTLRNFTLAQTNQDYDFFLRSSVRSSTACRTADARRSHGAAGCTAARCPDLRSDQWPPDLCERRQSKYLRPKEGRHHLELGQHVRLGPGQ